MDVSHQVLPGQHTLHVHKHGLPHHLQLLEVSIQPEEGLEKISTCEVGIILINLRPTGQTRNSPGHTVHSVLIGGWNQEADRRHRRLAAFIIQHPPLVGLRVVQQSAFISSVHCDLEEDKQMLMSDRCTD